LRRASRKTVHYSIVDVVAKHGASILFESPVVRNTKLKFCELIEGPDGAF
jgi:hypothetical protein